MSVHTIPCACGYEYSLYSSRSEYGSNGYAGELCVEDDDDGHCPECGEVAPDEKAIMAHYAELADAMDFTEADR